VRVQSLQTTMHRLKPQQTAFARQLRADGTDAERALWQRLRSRQLQGAKFRRQLALGPYVADLACVEARLIVECDGGQHNESARDARRDAWLTAQGWRVLRFWNTEVLQNIDGVLMMIAQALDDGAAGRQSPSPQPSPCKGEGANAGPPSPSQGEGVKAILPSPSQGEGQGEG
jgi:very-short-patch-repair endonuclease